MTDLETKGVEEKVLSSEVVEAESLPSAGLLSFYDRLRRRVTSRVEVRGGRSGRAAAEILLLVPDLFILLLRLSLDRRVPSSTRRLLLGGLAYFVTSVDLLPEAFLGPAGFLDDVVLAAALLSRALDPSLEALTEKYWSGSRRLRIVLGDISASAHHLLGRDLYRRLQRLLARWGVSL